MTEQNSTLNAVPCEQPHADQVSLVFWLVHDLTWPSVQLCSATSQNCCIPSQTYTTLPRTSSIASAATHSLCSPTTDTLHISQTHRHCAPQNSRKILLWN